jgi:hypothetical protein
LGYISFEQDVVYNFIGWILFGKILVIVSGKVRVIPSQKQNKNKGLRV